jgi:hypothetical protein
MKSIGDLDGIRRTLTGTLGISTCAIPADDANGRVILQPFGERLRLTIRQKVNGLAPLQIHQYCPVAMAAPPRPIVHPEDLYIISRFSRGGLADDSQDRVGAGLNA